MLHCLYHCNRNIRLLIEARVLVIRIGMCTAQAEWSRTVAALTLLWCLCTMYILDDLALICLTVSHN